MILLPAKNQILQDTVLQRLTAEKREGCDVTLYDFDNVSYKVLIAKDSNVMNVKLNAPYWKTLKDQGAEEAAKEIFGDNLANVTDEGPELAVDLDNVEDPQAMAEKIGLIRSLTLGGAWRKMCRDIRDDKPGKPLAFRLREDTKVFLVPKKNRMVTVFALDFAVKSDRIISETILTEFAAIRKKDRSAAVQSGPLIGWMKTPPDEIKGLDTSDCKGILGYLTIVMTSKHFENDEKMQNSIDNVLGFRSFLLYHLKCAKAFFHATMRARVKTLLLTLNRAKPGSGKTKTKKKGFGK